VAQPRTKEEIEKIRKLVQNALGIHDSSDETRKDEITVEEFPFNEQPAAEVAQTLQKDQKLQFWMQIVQAAGYPLAALVLFAMLWRVFKRAPDVDIPIGVPLGEFENAEAATFNGKPGTARGSAGVVTVDVLNQLIRENPQNMTQAIRGWMTRGGQSK
jgi:flagellar biosynthesis/type III secretory pathway M-ring protein FliF/YscJ